MTAAAFKATYSDWKLLRTRKVVQIVLEVPVELADHAYRVLDGMPLSGEEIWVAVARLNAESEVMPNQLSNGQHALQRSDDDSSKHDARPAPAMAQPTQPARAKQSWDELSPAQQAGMLCADKSFIQFLAGEYQRGCDDENEAADIVRWYCDVESRAEIKRGTRANVLFQELVGKYRAWMREPEFVG
jgi:hypothetical protein